MRRQVGGSLTLYLISVWVWGVGVGGWEWRPEGGNTCLGRGSSVGQVSGHRTCVCGGHQDGVHNEGT